MSKTIFLLLLTAVLISFTALTEVHGQKAAQPKLPDEGAVYVAPFLLNVSIWESLEGLETFTHQGKHATALEQRAQWFVQDGTQPTYVLYWIPKGHVVTEKDIKERLDHLGKHGPTPYAFTFEQPFTRSQASLGATP